MRLADLARTSSEVAENPARRAKIDQLAVFLRRLRPDEMPVAVAYLSGELPQAPIGVGWAALRDRLPPAPPPADARAPRGRRGLAPVGGRSRAPARRRRGAPCSRRLFARATEPEQRLLRRLLRRAAPGRARGVMAEAVARAAGVPAADVRRAAMLAGDLGDGGRGRAARRASRGPGARSGSSPLPPVQPMLAQTAADVTDALGRIGRAAVEWKLDGARIQVHRAGEEVRVFTRNLADITQRVPEVVEAVLALPPRRIVLDGEAIALDARRPAATVPGHDEPVRDAGWTSTSCAREHPADAASSSTASTLDGDDLLDRPARGAASPRSRAALPAELVVPRLVTDDRGEAERFLDDALARGHEGVMVKALGAPYEAGRRGAGWLKVKRAHTLDLVVLAAEWGHGRRQGGCRTSTSAPAIPATRRLRDARQDLQGHDRRACSPGRRSGCSSSRRDRDGHDRLRAARARRRGRLRRRAGEPALPGGLALRFARVKGYRPDKTRRRGGHDRDRAVDPRAGRLTGAVARARARRGSESRTLPPRRSPASASSGPRPGPPGAAPRA